MAVIMGCYESHMSGTLLPNVSNFRHRNFHDDYKKKKPIPRGEEVEVCAHVCPAAHIPARRIDCLYSLDINEISRQRDVGGFVLSSHDTCIAVWPCVFSRMYRAEKLPNTNLVFLITDAKATCLSCDPRPLRQAEQPCILSLRPQIEGEVALSSLLSSPPSITRVTVGL